MTENNFKRFLNPASIWALLWTSFQILVVIRGAFPSMMLRPMHVCFAMGLVFLTFPMFSKNKVPKGQKYAPKWYEYIFFILVLVCGIYMVVHSDRMMTRMALVDRLTAADQLIGILFILLLLESARRAVNLSLSVIAVVFILYSLYGNFLPGILGHRGQTMIRVLETQVFTTSGIFTSPTAVSVSMVFYFMLFGAFLTTTPASQLFINISNLLTRKTCGGAGKASIVASALFGMINNSAAATVTSIGTIMYPPMKKERFDPYFSGSMLAIGGTSAQLSPPIMGAAAFIMVDMAGRSYVEIMRAAIIPSILFFAALYAMIHLYSKRENLTAPMEDTKEIKKAIVRHLHLLVSIIVLVYMIISGYSIMRSATFATAALIVVCFFRKDTRLSLFKMVSALETAARQAIVVAMPCAVAGIIVGSIVSTGLGIRFSSMVNVLAQNSLLIALLATVVMSIILGLGMPTSAAYIMAATLLAPTLINLGLPVLVAHFFVFYYANLSMITPPVAMASFAAAGIVGVDSMKLCFQAFKYSLALFLIPFAFVYTPALLGHGTLIQGIPAVISTLIGIYALAVSLIGFCLVPVKLSTRLIFALSAILLVLPILILSIAGLGVFAALMLLQISAKKRLALKAT